MNKTHVFRLKPGNDLKAEIEIYVRANHILAGWISCGVGSLTDFNLRFAGQREGSQGSGHFEIVSLIGTVSVNGAHIHMSISDPTGKMIGGHLLDRNLVYTTAEIVIQESEDFVFTREKDENTQWKELQVKRKIQ